MDLWDVNGLLWISIFNGATYDLVNYDGGVAWNTPLSGLSTPVQQVAYDGTDEYVAVAGSNGYVLNAAFTVVVADSDNVTAAAASGYYGVFFNGANDTCFLATDDDTIVWTTDVTNFGSWTPVDSGETVWFKQFASIPGDLLLVGSHEDGFFEMDDESVGALVQADDVTPSDLRNGSVLDLYIDGTKVFVLTAGSGVWSATWSVSEWAASWVHE